jgi:phage-related protein (TIGR01555 family)
MANPLGYIDALKTMLTDGWENLKSGFGDARRDKRVHTVPKVDLLSYEDCAELYRASDLLQKVIDEPSHTAFREGWSVKVADKDADKEIGEQLDAYGERLKLFTKSVDVLRWSRMFGGGALFMGVNDGQLAEQPINEKQIKAVEWITALDARECIPTDWYSNASHPKYGEPRVYRVSPRVISTSTGIAPRAGEVQAARGELYVHESRIIPLFGTRPDRDRRNGSELAWGDSLLQRIWQHIADFDTGNASAATLLSEYATPVFKLKGLADLMASDRDGIVKKRIELLNLSRSVLRGVMIDAEHEDFARVSASLSGYDGVLIQLAQRVAAAADYPASLLFGTSPAGLNATGNSEVRFWYDRIKGTIQKDQLKPFLTRAFTLIALAKDAPTKGKVPEKWSVEPNPLWQESESEAAETHLAQAQADQIMLANGVVTPEEIRNSRFSGKRYSTDTRIESDEEIDSETDDQIETEEGAPRIDPKTGQPIPVPVGTTPKSGKPTKPGAPGAPGAPAAAGGAPSIQDTALNGTQVTSMIEVVTNVVKGSIPRESGVEILKRAFLMTPEDAEALLGPEDFEPAVDPIEAAKAEAIKNPPKVPGAPPGAPKPGGFPPGGK